MLKKLHSALGAEGARVLRYTRYWLLYGTAAFVLACVLIGAAEGLWAR